MPVVTNGSNQYYTAGVNAAQQIAGNLTIAINTKPLSLPGNNAAEWVVFQSIGGESSATNALYGFGYRNNGGTIVLSAFHESGNGSNHRVDTNIAVSANDDLKILIRRNITAKTYQFIVNNVDRGAFSYTTNPAGGGNTRLRIGAAYANGTNATQYAHNESSEIGIWSDMISDNDVTDYFNDVDISQIDTLNRVSHYRLIGGTATEVDSTGGYNLTRSGSPNSPVITTETNVSPNLGATTRQGYATDGTFHYTSDNDKIKKHNDDATWSIAVINSSALTGLTGTPNHIGDIAVVNGKIYGAVNNYTSCSINSDHQLVVWDASDLSLISTTPITDHTAAAAVAVDPKAGEIYIASYCDGSEIQVHDLTTMAYKNAITLSTSLTNIQGLAYKNGFLYAMETDGDLFQIVRDTGAVIWHENRNDNFVEYEGIAFNNGALAFLAHETGSTYKVHFITGVPAGKVTRYYMCQVLGDGDRQSEDDEVNWTDIYGPYRPAIYNYTKVFKGYDARIDVNSISGEVFVEADLSEIDHQLAVKDPKITYIPIEGFAGSNIDLDDMLVNVRDLTPMLSLLESLEVPTDDFGSSMTVRDLVKRVVKRLVLRQLLTTDDIPDGLDATISNLIINTKLQASGFTPTSSTVARDVIKHFVSQPIRTHYDG